MHITIPANDLVASIGTGVSDTLADFSPVFTLAIAIPLAFWIIYFVVRSLQYSYAGDGVEKFGGAIEYETDVDEFEEQSEWRANKAGGYSQT